MVDVVQVNQVCLSCLLAHARISHMTVGLCINMMNVQVETEFVMHLPLSTTNSPTTMAITTTTTITMTYLPTTMKEWAGVRETRAGARDADVSRAPDKVCLFKYLFWTIVMFFTVYLLV